MQKKIKKFSKFDLSAGGIMTSFKKKIVVNVEAESARTYSERERESLLEGWRSAGPLRNILVQRITMESKVISPVVNLLLLDIKTGGKSHCLCRVI